MTRSAGFFAALAGRKALRAASLVALATGTVVGPSAHATDRHWNVASGTWSTSANWSPAGVPGPSDNVFVDFFNGSAGTATVISNVGIPAFTQIINGDTVNVTSHGELGSGGYIIVGNNSTGGNLKVTASPPFFLNPGIISGGGALRLGVAGGFGLVTQNSGFVSVGEVDVGGSSLNSLFQSAGTYTLSGGVLTTPQLALGVLSGRGVVNQSGGTVSVGGDVIIGASRANGSPFIGLGTYNLSGGVLSAATMSIGTADYAAAGTLTLSGSGVANVGSLTVGFNTDNCSVFQFGGQMNINQSLDISAYTGLYSLTSGTVTCSGNTTVYVGGEVDYSGGAFLAGALDVRGRLLLSGGGGKVLRASSVSTNAFGESGLIDLSDNAMIVYYNDVTTIDSIRSQIIGAFNGGGWSGSGITSSSAAANPGHALGYARATDLFSAFPATFMGQTVYSTSDLVRYTLSGDSNLDGKVDLTDFTYLAANFNGSGKSWLQGDYNYDGTVNLTDFTFLASNFNDSLPAQTATSTVPEPAGTLFALVFAASRWAARRPSGASVLIDGQNPRATFRAQCGAEPSQVHQR